MTPFQNTPSHLCKWTLSSFIPSKKSYDVKKMQSVSNLKRYSADGLFQVDLILTAPDECLPHMKKLSRKHTPNIIPGYTVAVCNESATKIKKRNFFKWQEFQIWANCCNWFFSHSILFLQRLLATNKNL